MPSANPATTSAAPAAQVRRTARWNAGELHAGVLRHTGVSLSFRKAGCYGASMSVCIRPGEQNPLVSSCIPRDISALAAPTLAKWTCVSSQRPESMIRRLPYHLIWSGQWRTMWNLTKRHSDFEYPLNTSFMDCNTAAISFPSAYGDIKKSRNTGKYHETAIKKIDRKLFLH